MIPLSICLEISCFLVNIKVIQKLVIILVEAYRQLKERKNISSLMGLSKIVTKVKKKWKIMKIFSKNV
jgi:hypothetical protein